MKIKKILTQNRRDFTAIMECDHCGATVENLRGYDGTYYHKIVIPAMVRGKCGEKAKDDYCPLEPRYPDGLRV